MSLTFIFARDFQANVLRTGPETNPRPTRLRVGGGSISGLLKRCLPGSPCRKKSKAHIYQDALVMGPIYVIISLFLEELWIWVEIYRGFPT